MSRVTRELSKLPLSEIARPVPASIFRQPIRPSHAGFRVDAALRRDDQIRAHTTANVMGARFGL